MSLSRKSFVRRSFRQSLKIISKKDKDPSSRQEPLQTVSEGPQEEKKEEQEVEEELEEMYMLPELPHTPLSGTIWFLKCKQSVCSKAPWWQLVSPSAFLPET